nr:immunoglobulin heavy chain junction region [Macaca mulatta]
CARDVAGSGFDFW